MSTIPLATNERKRLGGRPTRYGVPAEQMSIYGPPELRRRLQREANALNTRDETNDWNAANVAVAILLKHFGMNGFNQETSDGR